MRLSPTTAVLVNLLSNLPDWSVLEDRDAWRRIKEEAVGQGVAPALAFLARSRVAPGEQRDWCDQTLTRSWNRHDASLRRLGKITELLADAGIPTVALKGPLLARRHYTPYFLRKPPLDLDLAVRPTDLARAVEALEAEGYTLPTAIRHAVRTSHHLVLMHAKQQALELHFRLSHGIGGVPVGEFFERAIPYQIPGGPSTWILDPADELFHLILHLVHDRFATLFHSWEVRRIWAAAPADVHQEVIRKAVKYRFAGVMSLVDIAQRALWGEPLLPPGVELPQTWLQGRLNEALFRQMTETARPRGEDTLATRLRGRWLELQTTDRPADALRRLGSILYIAWRQGLQGNWRTGRIPH